MEYLVLKFNLNCIGKRNTTVRVCFVVDGNCSKKVTKKSRIKMKIMRTIHSYLVRVGMTSQQSRKRHPFNLRNITSIIVSLLNIFSPTLFLIYDAKNLKETADTIFIIISVSTAMLNFVYVTWKMAEVFQFIENLDDIVNTSKSHGDITMKFIKIIWSNFVLRLL